MKKEWELHHGDCLDPVSGLASLADNSVDHVITDPPYEAEAHSKQRRQKRAGVGIVSEQIEYCAITEEIRTAAAAEFVRVSTGWIIVFCQVEAVPLWRDSIVAAGGRYVRAGIWIKPDAVPQFTGDRPGTGYEAMTIAHGGSGRMRWNGGGKHAVWKCGISELKQPDSRKRQGQKPLTLMESLIRDFTNPRDLVLDPFAGSGTTGVAAVRSGRRFVGWELDEDWHGFARERIGETKEQMRLL